MIWIVLLAAYLLGSIPFSYLVGRMKGVDVRRTGSGNVGASNVLRSAGFIAGLVALALDVLKGMLAVGLAQALNSDGMLPALAAMMAVTGHVFPVWLGFRGGKGVAVGAGAFGMLSPLPLLGAVCIFVLLAWLTRYISVGSIGAAVALPMLMFLNGVTPQSTLVTAVTAFLIVAKHSSNVVRLFRGIENKIGARQTQSEERRI
jgi:glycerol-3-phosphate acyltransferase PlsY